MSDSKRSVEINLLSERKHRLKRRRALLAKIQIFAGVVMAVYVAILLVVAGIRTAVAVQLNAVEDDIEEYERELGQLRNVETLYTVMVNKFTMFEEQYYNRMPTRETLEDVAALVPEGVTFNQVTFGESTNDIEVAFNARSFPEMVALLNVFEAVTVDSGDYTLIQVTGFGRGADGSYGLSVMLSTERDEV